MSKHVLNTRLTGARREGDRGCVGGNSVQSRRDNPIVSRLAWNRSFERSNEPSDSAARRALICSG